jgi:hypothetical protein
MRGLAAAALVLACGDALPVVFVDAGLPEQSYPIEGPDAVFSCAPEWCPSVEWAVKRWNSATGWNASVGEHGIPVVFSDDPADPAWGDCGQSDLLTLDGIAVGAVLVTVMLERPRACGDLHRTLTHELGHILCGLSGGDECHRGQCVMGRYSEVGSCHVIDDDALDTVCQRWGCPARKPEAQRLGSVVYPPLP